MTNRYRSSCCCDEQLTSVCFNGFGAVPKTAYSPMQEACIKSSVGTDGFNKWDNWNFCLHDKQEEVLAYSERTKERFVSGVFYPGGNPSCDCSCCNDPNANVTSYTRGKPPIYSWYRHMKNDGTQTVPVPTHFIDSSDTENVNSSYLYVWSTVFREDLKPPSYLYPCCAADHKYGDLCAWGHDYYCREEGYYWLCGYDSDDKQWMWWKDIFGNLSYVTQTQMKLMGDPTRDGWRTNDWGVVPGVRSNCPYYIPSCDSDTCSYSPDRTPGFCERGNEYLYLQDIVYNGPQTGDGRLFRNFKLFPSGDDISVVPDYGFGSCDTYPYGLWPLVFTFWGVMHREKWWEQYWNGIYRDDVCERDPDNPGEYLNCPDPYENYEIAESYDIYPDHFAGQCRFPRHIIQGCAGVPIFTHELVEKLDENSDVMEWWDGLDPSGDGTGLNAAAKRVYYFSPEGQILYRTATSPAALVMGAMYFRSGLWPTVTQKLQEVGILPDPFDYGEEHDYRIFKKRLRYHQPIGSGPTGACCIDVDEGGVNRPLYADCGVIGEGTTCPDDSTGSCNEEGADPNTCCDETPGRVGCGEGFPESQGGLCDDYICGINVDIGEDFENFLDSDLAQCVLQNTSVGGDPGSYELAYNILNELRFCCGLNADGQENPAGYWDELCVTFADYCGGATCGPSTLCAETTESVCRSLAGGQFTEGAKCIVDEDNPDAEIVNCKEKEDQIGSCCFYDNVLDTTSLLHCMEISKDLCNQLNADPRANNWGGIFSQIPETTIGGSQAQKDAIEEYAQRSINGIKTEYAGLHNCEPLPRENPDGFPLDTYAFYCGGEPYVDETDYPCDNTSPNTFWTEDDYYFYGRPGGWSHTCFGTDLTPDGDEIQGYAEYFNAFFPNVGRRGPSTCNANLPCWTALPFPQPQYSTDIPRCDKCCGSQNNCIDCPYEQDPGPCGQPLLSTCGTIGPSYYPGDNADDPSSNDYDTNPYPNANTGVFSPCITENVSSTCFGAWFQTHHDNFELSPGNCENSMQFNCTNVNNGFFLRVPEGRQEGTAEDYDLALDMLLEGELPPGGSDDYEWGSAPSLLAYINRILGEPIRLYRGYQHKIFMTDGSLNVTNLPENEWFLGHPNTQEWGPKVRLILLEEVGENEGVEINGKWWDSYNGNDVDIIVTDNGGEPGSNLFMNIDLTASMSSPDSMPDIYWGLVYHNAYEEGIILPVPHSHDEFGSINPLFGFYKISIYQSGQNPGPVVHGLRDYEWYHAPVTQTLPRPSAFYTSDWACSGRRCCNDKLTVARIFEGVEFACPLDITNGSQGQPGGESECDYTRLPSAGEGYYDPACGPCPEGTYCCAGVNNAFCIPEDTYCCDCLVEGEICILVDGVPSCVPAP